MRSLAPCYIRTDACVFSRWRFERGGLKSVSLLPLPALHKLAPGDRSAAETVGRARLTRPLGLAATGARGERAFARGHNNK